ncbi:MAG: site-2 protease family protein, partial [Anaerolineae bacterium]|nr:site-2 protease family protein [Anaerolineae bacterium]
MLLFNSNFQPSFLLGALLGVLIGMTVHEFAHNYVAHLMGDPYPKRSGRLTLNPAVHIYWPGFIMFLLLGFGILGTAPISAQRMRNPRWGYLAAVAAG